MARRRHSKNKAITKKGAIAANTGKHNHFGNGSCSCPCGKVVFGSKSEANRRLKGMINKYQRDGDADTLNAYECRVNPGVWHIGHSRYPRDIRRSG